MPSPLEPNRTAFSTPDLAGGELPLLAAVPAGQSAAPAAPGPLEAARRLKAVRASVLIIEDDPRGARVLSAHLQSEGHTVSIAHSALEAQQAVERMTPDVILCDVCLPDTDGIELTRWLRSRLSTAAVPIALVTSSDDSQILARGLAAGADDFLAKPVNPLELRTRVRSLLRSKMLIDEIAARQEAALPFGSPARELTDPLRMEAPPQHAPSVIIIEDNPLERRLLETQLTEMGCKTHGVGSANEALAVTERHALDLVVLDLLLPDRHGYELIADFRSDLTSRGVPILVVSGMSELVDRVKALELGADDFIVKGSDRLEFEARVRRLLRLKQSVDRLSERCNEALRMAVTDGLTGLYTYGFMQETLQRQLSCAQRYAKPYSIIFADIDHFKQINDRYGHAAGDAVLRAVAEALRATVRQSDTLVRYGGEEFVLLLPHTNRGDAAIVAEKMRETVAALKMPQDRGPALQVTLSLGVASHPEDAADAESLIERGDDAMYRAKQSGRNRVVACGIDPAEQLAVARILLVDDDDKNLRLLEAYLTPEGYELLHARNGSEAVEVARKQRLDVVIMDALMPKLSGYEACRRLKQDPKTQLIPVVLVTGQGERDDRLRGIEAGADEFITKPLDKIELLTRIRALVRQKRGTDVLEDSETVVFALARAVEDRDSLLRDHSERVSTYAVELGRVLGLSEPALDALRRAGVVHDIGKIAVPDSILLKPGKLTDEEWAIMRKHPETSYQLLRPLRTFGSALAAVRFHHERLDGSGYPLGLRGAEVPLLAQILAIADIYDALSAPRRYREAVPADQAADILRSEAALGLHDPRLVETFIEKVAMHTGSDATDPSNQLVHAGGEE